MPRPYRLLWYVAGAICFRSTSCITLPVWKCAQRCTFLLRGRWHGFAVTDEVAPRQLSSEEVGVNRICPAAFETASI